MSAISDVNCLCLDVVYSLATYFTTRPACHLRRAAGHSETSAEESRRGQQPGAGFGVQGERDQSMVRGVSDGRMVSSGSRAEAKEKHEGEESLRERKLSGVWPIGNAPSRS